MSVVSSKVAVGLGLFLILSLAVWWVYSLDSKSSPAVLDKLVRTVRWEGPWYYQIVKQTHTAKFIPTRVLDTGKLAFEVSLKRWQAAMALSRQGTNAWPVVPTLATTVMHKDISVGIPAAEALAGIHAEGVPRMGKIAERAERADQSG